MGKCELFSFLHVVQIVRTENISTPPPIQLLFVAIRSAIFSSTACSCFIVLI